MKIKLILVTIILVLFSCTAQEKSKMRKQDVLKNKKNTKMTTEIFDIVTFEKNKIDGEHNFTLADGTKVQQLSSDIDYGEIITPPKPNFFITSKQYYKTGILQSVIVSFPKSFLVLKRSYNNEGKLIDEINYDKPFKFTFEQLVELLKKEKDTINLYDINTTIGRGSDEKGTDWYVTYKRNWGRREVLKIDGITGQILERSFYSHLDN